MKLEEILKKILLFNLKVWRLVCGKINIFFNSVNISLTIKGMMMSEGIISGFKVLTLYLMLTVSYLLIQYLNIMKFMK
jgi:hypothetical protein